MGAQESQFCSIKQPTGFVPDLVATCKASGYDRAPQKMEVSDMHIVKADKVDRWSNDLGAAAECSGLADLVTCGGTVAPPDKYLADTQGQGAVVMDGWNNMPMWIDDETEDRVVDDTSPGDVSIAAAARLAR